MRHFRIDLDVDSAADFQQYLQVHDKFPNLQVKGVMHKDMPANNRLASSSFAQAKRRVHNPCCVIVCAMGKHGQVSMQPRSHARTDPLKHHMLAKLIGRVMHTCRRSHWLSGVMSWFWTWSLPLWSPCRSATSSRFTA